MGSQNQFYMHKLKTPFLFSSQLERQFSELFVIAQNKPTNSTVEASCLCRDMCDLELCGTVYFVWDKVCLQILKFCVIASH